MAFMPCIFAYAVVVDGSDQRLAKDSGGVGAQVVVVDGHVHLPG